MHHRALAPTLFTIVVLAVGMALPDVGMARGAFAVSCAVAVSVHVVVELVTSRALRQAPRRRTAARTGPRIGEQAVPALVLPGDGVPTSIELALLERNAVAVVTRRGRHRLVTAHALEAASSTATWWQLGRRVVTVDAGWPSDAVDPAVLGGVAVVTVGDLVLGVLVDRPLVLPRPPRPPGRRAARHAPSTPEHTR